MANYTAMDDKATITFPIPDLSNIKGLTTAEAAAAQAKYGKNEIPEVKESLLWMYIKQFIGPMPIMIEIAALLSALIKSWPDFTIICALLFTNGTLGFIEEKNAQASVDALKDGLLRELPILRDGKNVVKPVTELVPGDILFLRGGNIIPADCYFCKGDVMQVDQAALTGESLPVKVPRNDDTNKANDMIPSDGKLMYSGAILKQGECHCVVYKTGLYTLMGEAAAAIQESGGKAEGLFESKIKHAAFVLIVITLLVVFILFYYNYVIVGKDIAQVLEASLSLIIASVPVALPMVMKVTLSIGAKEMADHGGIVTHLTALEEIASMKVLCSDKTGTLTTAKMTVMPDKAAIKGGFTREQVMEFAAIASNAANKDDPIDAAVFRAYAKMKGLKNAKGEPDADAAKAYLETLYSEEKYYGFNPSVKRTVAIVTDKKTGKKLRIAKGILSKVLKTGKDVPEDEEDAAQKMWTVEDHDTVAKDVGASDVELASSGYKTIAVAVGQGDKMYFAGLLPISDPPREDTKSTIFNIRDSGVAVKMITGDHLNIAKELARQIDLGQNILPNTALKGEHKVNEDMTPDDLIVHADGFAQVLPLDKLAVVDSLQKKDYVVGMTGDGVNDAPALAKAQIGIAVEGATDAAQSAADIVLTRPGLSPIHEAIMISRRIFKRLKSYVIYRICITVQVVFFLTAIAFLYKATFKPLYIILLALLHDLQIVTIAYDKQTAGHVPETPTVLGLLLVSYTMGILMATQTTLMYAHGRDYLDPAFHCMPTVTSICEYKDSAVFLQISNSSAILILSARALHGFWFMNGMPAWQIIFSTSLGQVIVNSLMLFAPPALSSFVHPVTAHDIGLIWVYDFIWIFILDVAKIIMNKLWDSHEQAHRVEDPFVAKQRRRSMNSTAGRKPSVKQVRLSFKKGGK